LCAKLGDHQAFDALIEAVDEYHFLQSDARSFGDALHLLVKVRGVMFDIWAMLTAKGQQVGFAQAERRVFNGMLHPYFVETVDSFT
jgi:hypothetical protein